MKPHEFTELIRDYAGECASVFGKLNGGQPEDQLKPLVGGLLQKVGPLAGLDVEYRTEMHEGGIGRPDIGVIVGNLLTGHIELKAPGLGARPEHFKGENGKQWKRFRALPNLIYTDGAEWSLYRHGERAGRVRIINDIEDGPNGLRGDAVQELRKLLIDFLHWEPAVPASAEGIASFIAPLARFLRDDVEAALKRGSEPLQKLAREWRGLLFPEADDAQFADAYAQTLTYALLLARFEGAESLDPFGAAAKLEKDHALLAAALQLIEYGPVRQELETPIALLERVIGAIEAVDPQQQQGGDYWLYFYEHFLGAYDAQMRKDLGVYFTPVEVVGCQVRLAAELLRTRFDKPLAFADDGVQILDPAVGTGTYPLAIIDHAEQAVTERYGVGAVANRMNKLAERLEAFELLVGPYAVARLRITQRLHQACALTKAARVYLADTLASPTVLDDFRGSILQEPITADRKAAQQIKRDQNITVCIGNPPYDRGKKGESAGGEGAGGWVVHGDGAAEETPLIDAFAGPVIEAGQGGHLKNIYNSYVYFWRWALWKVFESPNYRGIVSFITASSYLRGPAFAGMRRVMRETFDELWIIDLEGDSLGARKTENVFAIRTSVAIAVGVRNGPADAGRPARVHKAKLTGAAEEKLAKLGAIERFADLQWAPVSDEWDAPLYPTGRGTFFDLPPITDIFPWQHSGVQLKRAWPIGETKALLATRWKQLLALDPDERRTAFHETTDRKIDSKYPHLDPFAQREPPISEYTNSGVEPHISRYAYRSFDRQWVIADVRIGDRMRPPLWRTHSTKQMYLTSLLSEVLGKGSSAVVTDLVPDLHAFCGRGAKDVIPLYRDAEAAQANVTDGLLDILNTSAEDLLAYAYGILAQPAYVERFWDQLELPPPRLPITKDRGLFERVRDHGRRLIFLHTYGERFGGGRRAAPRGAARNTKAVSQENYPESHRYNAETRTLHVGGGEFAPVPPEVYGYSVSGLRVVESWLDYRKLKPKGRKSSPLDEIRPESWTFGEELLELLWVLEGTIDLQPEGARLLDAVLASDLYTADELPKPTKAEQQPPQAPTGGAGQMPLDP